MASESDIQKLELRIKELEDQLKSMRSSQPGSQISAEDMQAFQRVRDALLGGGGASFCLTECTRCIGLCIVNCISVCIQRCIFECSCGPCLQERPLGGGGGRFGGLGG